MAAKAVTFQPEFIVSTGDKCVCCRGAEMSCPGGGWGLVCLGDGVGGVGEACGWGLNVSSRRDFWQSEGEWPMQQPQDRSQALGPSCLTALAHSRDRPHTPAPQLLRERAVVGGGPQVQHLLHRRILGGEPAGTRGGAARAGRRATACFHGLDQRAGIAPCRACSWKGRGGKPPSPAVPQLPGAATPDTHARPCLRAGAMACGAGQPRLRRAGRSGPGRAAAGLRGHGRPVLRLLSRPPGRRKRLMNGAGP